MIPLRFLFRSRWAALAWAAGICWTAVNFAGGQGGAGDANGVDGDAALNAVAAALE